MLNYDWNVVQACTYPCRINSTAWYDGKNLIITSPSPVAVAPPTSWSTYAPAPMQIMIDRKNHAAIASSITFDVKNNKYNTLSKQNTFDVHFPYMSYQQC